MVMWANAGRIAVLLIGAVAATEAGVTVPLLLAVAVSFGILDAIHNPAAMTLPRQLVRTDDLPSAAGLMQVAGRRTEAGDGRRRGVVPGRGGVRRAGPEAALPAHAQLDRG
jgi:hypothetical protein